MDYLPAAWVDPLSTDPLLFVNRTQLVARTKAMLLDLLGMRPRSGRVLVTGERGVGKSIFTRHVLAQVAAEDEGRTVLVEVDGRNIEYRTLLTELATAMYTRTGEAYGRCPPWLEKWREQLKLLANHVQVRRSQAESINRQFEVAATASLLDKLGAQISWREQRQTGTTVDAVLEVSDALLHAALSETMRRLDEDGTRVLLFYDNLDQAIGTANAERVQTLLRGVLALGHNVSVVHLRTEVLIADVRREFGEVIEVPPLPREELLRILDRRLERVPKVRDRLEAAGFLDAFRRLSGVAATPLSYLHWCKAVLRVLPAPLPSDWLSEGNRHEVVAQAAITGVDRELLRRFARVADGCMRGDQLDPWCRRGDLLGERPVAGPEQPERLSEDAVRHLETLGLLYPKERFAEPPIYRVDPVLDLLRPSVVTRLGG